MLTSRQFKDRHLISFSCWRNCTFTRNDFEWKKNIYGKLGFDFLIFFPRDPGSGDLTLNLTSFKDYLRTEINFKLRSLKLTIGVCFSGYAIISTQGYHRFLPPGQVVDNLLLLLAKLLLLLAKSVRPIKPEYAARLPMFCALCWRFTCSGHCLDQSIFWNPSRQSLSIIFHIHLPKYWPNGCELHWKIRRWSTVNDSLSSTLGTESSDILSVDGHSYANWGRSRS